MSRPEATLSRRQWLAGFWKPTGEGDRSQTLDRPEVAAAVQSVVIQGRHCLAYRSLMCTTCTERCPEPGAIELVDNAPRINPDLCTACGVCHDVCPAPQNAVLLISRQGGS